MAISENLPLSNPDPNDVDLLDWLARVGGPIRDLVRLQGDVSPRRYCRVHFEGHRRAIVAIYPGFARETQSRFAMTTALLEAADVPCPEILAEEKDRGWTLLEDVGDATLYDTGRRREEGWEEALAIAADQLLRIQSVDASRLDGVNPPLDRALFERELTQTWETCLAPSGLDPEKGLGRSLDALLDQVLEILDEAPRVPCHRDYMARNLAPGRSSSDASWVVSVLDHQDLRMGPRAYDLASLLNDSLYPDERLCGRIARRLSGTPGALPVDPAEAEYLSAVAQRCFKIVGTFHTFAERGFDRYLPLVAPSLARATSALARLEPSEGPTLARALACHFESSGWPLHSSGPARLL